MGQRAIRTGILFLSLLVLGLSPLGFIVVGGAGQAITLLHLPMILAATLEGPIAGGLLGIAFGFIAGFHYAVPELEFHVLVRVIAGVTTGFTYMALNNTSRRGSQVTIASAGAATAGTLVNTSLMTLVVLLTTSLSPQELFSVAIIHGIVELFLALIVTVPLTVLLSRPAP